jgi:hypothetical protein
VTPAEELRRVREGADSQVPPAETDMLEAPGDEATLGRVREVLEIVPAWFTVASVDDAEVRDCVLDRWSLRAWTYWFQPDLRKWRWWDARVDDGRVLVTLLVLQRPYLRGALEWLLEVARDT